jgi:hypothetical protein
MRFPNSSPAYRPPPNELAFLKERVKRLLETSATTVEQTRTVAKLLRETIISVRRDQSRTHPRVEVGRGQFLYVYSLVSP